jgi:aminomethyltransferase
LEPDLQPTSALKRTPFHAFHQALGAKLVEFAGFEMPLRYAGDVREHLAVRRAAGLFDISHMGEFEVRGPAALDFVDRAITNDAKAMAVGQALYSPMCRPDGGIVDDLLVYRYADHLMLVVNAANISKDWAWLQSLGPSGCVLTDRSDETALLAVQGPRAAEVFRGQVPDGALELGYYRFVECRLFGAPVTLSRTGYTGEDGFEVYFPPAHAEPVWNGLVEAGRAAGMEPVGLGARDTLRLEMAYMLYGNDITDATSPLEAGLGWTVKLEKPDFVGREFLLRQKQAGLQRRLVGMASAGRRVARHGMKLLAGGQPTGEVTSGSFSPCLEKGIALGYVGVAHGGLGTTLEADAGGQRIALNVVKRPFYTHGTHR